MCEASQRRGNGMMAAGSAQGVLRDGRTTLFGLLVVALGAALLTGCERSPRDAPAGAPAGAAAAVGAQPAQGGSSPSSGVRRMAERLDEIVRTMNPEKNRFMNRERVRILSAVRGREPDPLRRAKITMDLALELIRLGANEQAIATLQPLLSPPPDAGFDWPPPEHVRAL